MLYEKAFQKGLWEAVRAEKAYAPLLSALLGGLPRCFQRGACQRGALQRIYIYQETGKPEKI